MTTAQVVEKLPLPGRSHKTNVFLVFYAYMKREKQIGSFVCGGNAAPHVFNVNESVELTMIVRGCLHDTGTS